MVEIWGWELVKILRNDESTIPGQTLKESQKLLVNERVESATKTRNKQEQNGGTKWRKFR